MLRHAAEADVGEATCFVRRNAARGEIGRFHVDVEAHLVVDLALERASPEHAQQPSEHLRHPGALRPRRR
jgi:hypothetical protein